MSRLSKVRLYGLIQLAEKLLIWEPRLGPEPAWLEPFLGVFGIAAICCYDASRDRADTLGCPSSVLEGATRATYTAGQDQDDPGITIRRLVTGERTIGAIAFSGLESPELTADPLAALAAALVEGMRLQRAAAETAVTAEINAFRSATFDVLGGECKNALTTILAASGGLREAGPLRAEQLEMARMVEDEASRLGGLISRLDWIARLDQGEVSPRMDPTNLTALVTQVADQWSRITPDRKIVFESRDALFTTLADPELLRLALSQLLDNACKFSAPGAAVRLTITNETGGAVVINVSSDGVPIPEQERDRIFERSYIPAQSSNFAVGSGLGLYTARRIAAAHGGTLDLDPEGMQTHCIAFRLSLPSAEGAPDEERMPRQRRSTLRTGPR